MSGRRIDVTATQAVTSMLATLTGAIAASSLGIAGTVIGAAFMSLASTVGAAVYKHYIGRSHERLRAAAANLPPLARGSAAAAAVVHRHRAGDSDETTPVRHDGRAGANGAGVTGTRATGAGTAAETTAPDAAETEILSPLVGLSGGVLDGDRSRGPETPHDLGSPAATAPAEALHAANGASALDEDVTRTWFRPGTGGPSHTAGVANGAAGGGAATAGSHSAGNTPPGPKTRDARQGSRRKWLIMAGAALGVFVIAMGAITAFEAIAGKPLEAVVWHRQGSGTTLGGLVKNSPQQSSHSSTGPSSTGSAQPSTTPSNPATPTPTPSSSAPGSSPPASAGTGASSAPGTAQTNGAASPAP